MSTLSNLINISPGFKAAVNIIDDFANDQKVAAYLPTAFGREILDAVASSLDVVSTDRARIIHGNFGTGKSHLALLLARFLAEPWGHPVLAPVLEKIKVRDPELYQRLKDARSSIPLPFLIVRMAGYRGSIAEGLLTALDQSLQAAGLGSLMPETMFHAAIKRLEQVETEYSAHKAALDKAIMDHKLVSVAALKENLGKYRPDALEAFRRIHPQFSAGAPFPPHHEQRPYAVYRAVADKLIETHKYGGIFVLWDELGENLRQLVSEHHRREYLDLQEFAEVACAGSRDLQIHFLGLTHQSLGEFISTASSLAKDTVADLNKMAGRFTQRAVRAQDGEIYRLMDEILIPTDKDQFDRYAKEQRHWFERWSEQAYTLSLFPTLTSKEVLEVIGEGCYPMHPAAAFCLPELSEKVAQNERTLFYFLSAIGPGTLSDYLINTPLPTATDLPPIFTVDCLWDYFAPLIRDDSRRIGAKNVWHQYEQTPKTSNSTANRVLRVVALLQLINDEKLRPTADTIIFCLGAVGSQKDEILGVLAQLSTGPTRALTHSRNTGEYAFAVGTGLIDLEEEIRQAVEARAGLLSPVTYIQKLKIIGLATSIDPTDHNDTFSVNRRCDVHLLTVKELEESDLKDQGPSASPADGVALVVLAGDQAEVARARAAAATFTNPRVLIAVPKEPIGYDAIVRRLDALDYLRKEKAEIFGDGKAQAADWQDAWADDSKLLRRELEERLGPGDAGPAWFWKGKEQSSITGMPRLKKLASAAMDEAYNRTLRISHDKLLDDSWDRDQQAKYRRAAVNYLFRPGTGPREAALVESSAEQKVIRAVWMSPGYLRNENGDWVVGRPVAVNATTAAEIWDVIEQHLKAAQEQERDFYAIVSQLRNPPYGLRIRVLPLLLAAVMQTHFTKLVVTRGGAPVSLDGDVLEKIVQAPRQYRVRYVELSDREESILKMFEDVFGVPEDDDVNARVTAVKNAVSEWLAGLSQYAKATSTIPTTARTMLTHVLMPMAKGTDPWPIVINEFPAQVNIPHLATATPENMANARRTLTEAKSAYDEVLQGLQTELIGVINKVFAHPGHDMATVITAATTWYSNLSPDVRSYPFSGDSSVLVEWAKSLTAESTSADVLRIATRLMSQPLANWSDTTAPKFEGKLETVLSHVSTFVPPNKSDEVTDNPTVKDIQKSFAGKSEPPDPNPRTGLIEGKTVPSHTAQGGGTSPLSKEESGAKGKPTRDSGKKPSVRILIDEKQVNSQMVELDGRSKDLLNSIRALLAGNKAKGLGRDRLLTILLRLIEERMSS